MPFSRRFILGALTAFAAFQALAMYKGAAAEPLRIGVIGAGSLGGTVGRLLVQAGHEVLFSSRHPEPRPTA